MRRIKVLHIITTTVGGAGNSVLNIVKYLDKDRFEPMVAFSPGYAQDKDFYQAGIRIFLVKMSRNLSPWINAVGFFQLYALLRRERFDIVHTHCSVAGFLGRLAAKLAGVPVIIFSIRGYASRDYQSCLKKGFFLWIERQLDKVTHYYVAVSEAMKQKGIQKKIMRPETVSVIHNSIELEHFKAKKKDRETEGKKKELGLKPQGAVVGIVARFEAPKGLEYFLQSGVLIQKAFPQVQLLMVGDGPLRPRVEKMITHLGLTPHVILTGWREDIPQVLRVMDVFCLSSLWESFGLAIVEAMAAEKPVVATRVEGIPEVVQDGVTGILVPPKDAQALAQAVIRLLKDPQLALKMGKAGRRRVEELFAVQKMVARYEELYEKLWLKTQPDKRG